jgi:hypothetical protein
MATAKDRWHVGLGSIATELGCPRDVRFTPDSDRTADIRDWQLRANNGSEENPPNFRSKSRTHRLRSQADKLSRRRNRHCHRQSAFDPAFSSFAITASRLKLAGFCRTGYSLKLCSHWAANACIGTWTKARSAIHLL